MGIGLFNYEVCENYFKKGVIKVTKYFYMKILGLFIVVLGFSYCMTSFYNFYDYIFGTTVIANSNIVIMTLGLIFPLYTFIFGVYFYFYTDKDFGSINFFVMSSAISMMIVGIARIIISDGIMTFLHSSFAYVMLVLSIFLIYGCIKYKY